MIIFRAIAPHLFAALLFVASGPGVPACAQRMAALSPLVPSAEVTLPPRPDGALLKVAVTAVRNPQLVPISLRVTLQDAERRGPPEDVTRFALFPPDQPGAALVRPDAALDRLRRALGAAPTLLIAHVAFDVSAESARVAPPAELQIEAAWVPAPRPSALR